jgi:outer membrane protein assembly factor BamB
MAGRDAILIGIQGTVLALDPATGQILWNNKLKGLGTSFVTIAGAAQVPAIARRKQLDDESASAGAVAASS